MLLLNVIKIFDNVSHFELLHNLKKRRIKKHLFDLNKRNFFEAIYYF